MGSSVYLFMITRLLFLLACFHPIMIASSSSKHLLCRNDESAALLQFNQSFFIIVNSNVSYESSAYPKTASWKLEEGSDCCSWDGVECDDDTGHVIGLDLRTSFLYGSINSSSSLFRLLHLRKLDLAGNHFNYSQIPSTFGHLSRLTYLNLSDSYFSGRIPSELSKLSKLATLDLSGNVDYPSLYGLLKLEKPGPSNLIQNLSGLKDLHLSNVNISSAIPDILANFSSLESLLLSDCGLHGEFPSAIFQLPNLQTLSVTFNPDLTGYLPEFNKSSPLQSIKVAGTGFSGKVPDSIGNLNFMSELDIRECNFSGSVPPSLGNLTQLTLLDLSSNNFSGGTVAWIGKQTKLTYLSLGQVNLTGEIPSFLQNLTQLAILRLDENQLTGQIPSWLGNLTQLSELRLDFNKLHGPIPPSIYRLVNLEILYLNNNFLTGFDKPPVVLPWTGLRKLDLKSNMLKGSLPIPPPSTVSYYASDNLLTGEIPPLICNLTSLYVLDLSNNNFSGPIPKCLGIFNDSVRLLVLNLRNNSFHGAIPQTCTNGSKLRMIDLSQNQLQGSIPGSLANCKMLEILNLGNNQINDTFPSWFGTFPELRVLILRSNEFHGAIRDPKTNLGFPKLCIIDLSYNSFTGKFPSEYFKKWISMKGVDEEQFTYMRANTTFETLYYLYDEDYNYSMTITNKGTDTVYLQIPDIFTAIDLSSNRFEGDIPESIGNLKGLRLLNLSNNIFTGHIPSCLGSLTNLESLDLSQNKLSGNIPQQLVGLTFLAVLNLSHNHLTGPIPHGNQFDTFQNNSFEGNLGLCGNPLSKKCGNSEASPPPPLTSEQDEDLKFPSRYDRIFILVGYGSGLVVGLVIGHIVTTRKHEWFVETFGRKPRKWQRGKKRGRQSTRI